MSTRPLAPALLAAAALASCSGTPTATIDVTTGGEADAFTRAPAPVTLVVDRLALDGTSTEVARQALPAKDVSLGDAKKSEAGAIRVRALGANGETLLAGESLFVQFGALETTPLEIFVQRTGELARMPDAPPDALDAPRLSVVAGRYLVGASGTRTVLYDLLTLRSLDPPTLPRPARSLAAFATSLIAIDDQGASAFELQTGGSTDLPAPSGGSYAEVAGGATIRAPDGSAYVVGATRTTGESARVLRISAEGDLSFASLSAPREGACASWVEGRGLVVVGGSAAAAGAEVIAKGAGAGAPLPYPPVAVKGCGAATLDASHVLVAGGAEGAGVDGGGRVFDLACAASCAPAPWAGAIPLARAEAVTLAPDAALVVGEDASGATRAFRAAAAGVTEVPLRVPRRGARLIAVPTGGVAIVGGAPEIEQYRD